MRPPDAQNVPEIPSGLEKVFLEDPITICIQDAHLRFVWVHNLHSSWGEVGLLGKNDYEAMMDMAPEAVAGMVALKKEIIRTGERKKFEQWLTAPSGDRFFFRSSFDRYEFPDGSKGIICKYYDLTDQRLSEEALEEKIAALKESEAKLEAALGDEILASVQDNSLRFVWVSMRQPGWDADAMLGKTDLEVIPDKEQARWAYDMKRGVIDRGEPYHFAGWVLSPNGERRYQQGTIKPYPMPDGTIGVVGKIIDVTELKAIQEKVEELNRALEVKVAALEDSEEKFRLAMEGFPILLAIQDINSKVIWQYNQMKDWNKPDPVGYVRANMTGQTLSLDMVDAIKRRVIETGVDDGWEGWFTNENGKTYYLRGNYHQYTFPDGTKGAVCRLIDMTQQKIAEEELHSLNNELRHKIEALEDSEQKFKAALEGEQLALAIDDADLKPIWRYHNIKEWTGIERNGYAPEDFKLRSLPTNASEEIKRRVLETGEVQRAEDWITFPDGKEYYLKGTYYPYHFPDGSGGVISRVFNLTQNKLIEEELGAVNAKLGEKVQALEEAERRFEVGLKGEPISLWIQDKDSRYLWVHNVHPNWAALDIIGKTDEELVPQGWKIFEQVKALREQVLKTGERAEMERWVTSLSGKETFLHTIFEPYPLPGGERGVIGKTYDLTPIKETERKVTELNDALQAKLQELEETQEKLNKALEGEPITLAIQDENLKYIWAHNTSPKFVYSQENMAKGSPGIVKDEDARSLDEVKARVRDTKKPETFFKWLNTQTGHRAYMKLSYGPYPLPNGKTGVIGKAYDLTEHQLAQERVEELNWALEAKVDALEDSEQKFQLALDGEPIILFIADSQLRYTWAYNLPKGLNVIGKTDLEVHPDPEAARMTMDAKRKTIETGQRQVSEGWTTDKLGQRVYRKSIYDPHPMPDGTVGVIGKHYNLTESKLAEDNLKVLNKALDKEKREVDAALKKLSEEHQRKLNDLAEASRLQHALLPKNIPLGGKLDFAAHMATCLEVGGDYYDFKEKDGQVLFAIGDATGHGLQSGTIVAMVKSYFQLLALNLPIDALMDTISESLTELDLRKMFMGLLLLEYHTDGFLYSSAGMPPVLVHRAATGEIDSYMQKRVFLGTGLATHSSPIHIPMSPGDILVSMSDGIIESTDPIGTMLPVEDIYAAIKSRAPKGAKAVVEGLFTLQRTWMENRPLKDDTTVMAIRFK